MTCTPAPACKAMLVEATTLFPNRSTASDGICASPKHHQQNPTSDHETGDAVDLTHDPAHGCDVDELFARIVASRDPRVKYLIRNKRMLRSYDKPGIPAWTWAPYTGSNPHDHHGHCSILPGARDDTWPWFIPQQAPPIPPQENDMPMVYATDPTKDASQVLDTGSALIIIKHGDSAQALDRAGVKTVTLNPGDYADIKQQASNRDD